MPAAAGRCVAMSTTRSIRKTAMQFHPGTEGQASSKARSRRWRFDDRWGAAAFVDAGTAFDDREEATDLSWGVGIGPATISALRPRVDLAIPLDEDESSDDFALYISLGQAFERSSAQTTPASLVSLAAVACSSPRARRLGSVPQRNWWSITWSIACVWRLGRIKLDNVTGSAVRRSACRHDHDRR